MRIRKRVFIILGKISIITLFFYFLGRIYIFSINSAGSVNLSFAVLLLLAEGHSILQSMGYILGILRVKTSKSNYHRRAELDEKNLPGVTVMVPARNEPLNVLEATFISLMSLDYANKSIVFLDGSDKELQEKNRELAEKYNIRYFCPEKPSKSKAEIINRFLPEISTEYLSVFDADQNPMPQFLTELVSLAEYSGKIGFIQTPQLYSNLNVSPIARAAALQQSIFFEGICEAKGSGNAMFCCGTNFLMRADVLKKVGGFDENSVTEDFSTSIKIHSLGYRSIYYPHVRVFGMAPETLEAYFKQQHRWSSGTVSAVRRIFFMLFKGELRFSPIQFWEYFLSATYYFTGWSFFILMLCPALYLIFEMPSYFANPYFYIGTFIPYYIFTLLTFYTTMKERHYNFKDVFRGMTMGSLNFPVFMQSTIAALLNKKISFQITDKSGKGKMPVWRLWPWAAMILLNAIAISLGVIKFSGNPYAITVNIIWCAYHIFLLCGVFQLNRKL